MKDINVRKVILFIKKFVIGTIGPLCESCDLEGIENEEKYFPLKKY